MLLQPGDIVVYRLARSRASSCRQLLAAAPIQRQRSGQIRLDHLRQEKALTGIAARRISRRQGQGGLQVSSRGCLQRHRFRFFSIALQFRQQLQRVATPKRVTDRIVRKRAWIATKRTLSPQRDPLGHGNLPDTFATICGFDQTRRHAIQHLVPCIKVGGRIRGYDLSLMGTLRAPHQLVISGKLLLDRIAAIKLNGQTACGSWITLLSATTEVVEDLAERRISWR